MPKTFFIHSEEQSHCTFRNFLASETFQIVVDTVGDIFFPPSEKPWVTGLGTTLAFPSVTLPVPGIWAVCYATATATRILGRFTAEGPHGAQHWQLSTEVVGALTLTGAGHGERSCSEFPGSR